MAAGLPTPPFLSIPGLPNFRDVGGYEIAGQKAAVRRNLIYRSSEPSRVTDEGIAELQRLGITHVYDLRSLVEIDRGLKEGHGWQVKEWSGAERIFAPVFLDQDYSPEALALRYKNYASEGPEGFVEAYGDILKAGSTPENSFQPYSKILQQLADPSPPGPVLIHCTAGKDRTGVICALILSLCGVPDEVVAHEYNLTDLGLRERHAEFINHLMHNPALKDYPDGARRMVSARKEAMAGTLAMIREEYGSIEKCVVDLGLLSPAQIEQLRRNLVVDLKNGEDVVDWQKNAKLVPSL